jgi:hypothetical protein
MKDVPTIKNIRELRHYIHEVEMLLLGEDITAEDALERIAEATKRVTSL